MREPLEWHYHASDLRQLKDIHRQFGTRPLKTFPLADIFTYKLYYRFVKGVQVVKPLNYVPFHKEAAMQELVDKFGWQRYAHKHYESRFTRFYEGYWLPTKFGYDKRRAHFSSLILTGQMTRDEALTPHRAAGIRRGDPRAGLRVHSDQTRPDRDRVARHHGGPQQELQGLPERDDVHRSRHPRAARHRRPAGDHPMITIVDYGLGNIRAFSNMYKRMNIEARTATCAAELAAADKIILPGVGAFDHAMELLQRSGMRQTLDELVLGRKVPVLGICVGMQILAESSDEGVLPGLGWIAGRVRAFKSEPEGVRAAPAAHGVERRHADPAHGAFCRARARCPLLLSALVLLRVRARRRRDRNGQLRDRLRLRRTVWQRVRRAVPP